MITFTRRLAAVVAAGAATAAVLAGTGPAQADKVQYKDATGTTTVQLAPPIVKALAGPGCGGFLVGFLSGGATGTVTPTGAIQLNFPVRRFVQNPNNGAFRIAHDGVVEIANGCYDLTFSNLYVQNLGPNGITQVQVLAKTIGDGVDQGRTEAFTLDFSSSYYVDQIKNNGKRLVEKIRSLNLLLGDDGAAEFNNLITGSDSGPLYPGEQVGKSRIVLKIPLQQMT